MLTQERTEYTAQEISIMLATINTVNHWSLNQLTFLAFSKKRCFLLLRALGITKLIAIAEQHFTTLCSNVNLHVYSSSSKQFLQLSHWALLPKCGYLK